MYDPFKVKIDGWMSEEELKWLFEQAQKMDSILEIGSWCGRSTTALCSGCKGAVFAIDHFKGSIEHQELIKGRDIFKEFRANMKGFNNLITIIADSTKIVDYLIIDFDMLFVDGGHEYETVLADLEGWGSRAKKMIVGHDISENGVPEAVKKYFGNVEVEHGPDSLWYVSKMI
jgi:precorrin-6B methylase 2